MLSEYMPQDPGVASTYHGIAWTPAEFAKFKHWLSERDARVKSDQIKRDMALVRDERLTDNTGEGIDVAYNEALGDAETALRAQLTEGDSDE